MQRFSGQPIFDNPTIKPPYLPLAICPIPPQLSSAFCVLNRVLSAPSPPGRSRLFRDIRGTLARVRSARVYRPWDGGTAVHPQATYREGGRLSDVCCQL